MKNYKILSYDEENKLLNDELIEYYIKLKIFLKNVDFNLPYKQYLNFCEVLNRKFIRSAINVIKGYNLIVEGIENIPHGPVIYASSHQDFNDHFNVVLAIPEHAIILNTKNVTPLFKFLMGFNGMVYVDRNDSNSRFNSKLKLMQFLAHDKSIVIFPEGTWNCSPNKLHLPMHKGVVDIARKMQVPIVPLIQEYVYDDIYDGKNRVLYATVKFGQPISVDFEDDRNTKLNELEESISTLRYELIERKGTFVRDNIRLDEYLDYVQTRINNWRLTKVNIDDERKTIYGFSNEQYFFNHINDVPYDKYGEVIPTEEVRKILRINQQHLL